MLIATGIQNVIISAVIFAPGLLFYGWSRLQNKQKLFESCLLYTSAKHSDEIQAAVYKNSQELINRNKEVLFYDCTNYFFEIEENRGNAQFGKSKEHRPNPIVQMGLFLDGDGFPLCFSMFPGNKNEQPTLKPLEKKILKDFKLSEFIVCTDAGLASTENRKFNTMNGRSYICLLYTSRCV